MKDTIHHYKGYDIIGTTYLTYPRNVRAGNSYRWVDSTVKRNYNIKKNGKYVINPNLILETLKYAKWHIDNVIEKK
jgi:hypothetical protein